MQTIKVDWLEVSFGVGSSLIVDGNRLSRQLVSGLFFPLHLTSNAGGPIESSAVRVEVTGRTVQRFQGERAVRCKVTFLNDPTESHLPEVSAGAWLYC